ncbi:type II 3-dehydroquinate dehydratase [Pleionea sp. CnH1-48]|uniref:type II 3-dehydroquinate dehydratase n=1 Tax=Pleionea sp. CnH1-48 TaxID=2954494 RepID=UPI002097877A|nr:type II 3-dehydroquinate dehydratase [Pleionea sp. CnH1-48]MCO7224659.1 type II 3-dehydroquinate dehydratase [Pleionea sp. CnH1-48]
MPQLLLLNGPNLNLLGTREPEKYGHTTLEDIVENVKSVLAQHQIDLAHFQSNAEHELIERIHSAKQEDIRFIIFNPAAFTHTSVAIRDAILATDIPFIEVHLTNPHRREAFRHTSYFSDIAEAVIAGFGAKGYEFAALSAAEKINSL